MKKDLAVFWFRRDLRLHDNTGLYHALRSGLPVLPLFIFDTTILHKLADRSDRRVTFIHAQIERLKNELLQLGSDIKVAVGTTGEVWKLLITEYSIKAVYCNHDYEPAATKRDAEIRQLLEASSISFHTFKDQCIFEKTEITKEDGSPYTVFTPYSKKWKARLNSFYISSYPNQNYFTAFLKTLQVFKLPSLEETGFKKANYIFPSSVVTIGLIKDYARKRDYPSLDACSHLGIHFRFGTISIRDKARKAQQLSDTWLNELIWRDFYMMILAWFPQVVTHSFRPGYDRINWRNNEEEFERWCKGLTGYPLVDAGMRQLNETGYMHNRLRMLTASFLTKHLLIDWRWGEAYFASKLLDYDLSANNGGWQWATGCGTDAAPYFRIFNPALQADKFDKDGEFVKEWVPEVTEKSYPSPIVAHEFARNRCLQVYKQALV